MYYVFCFLSTLFVLQFLSGKQEDNPVTKGIHGGKQRKKSGQHKHDAPPEAIQEHNQTNSQTEDSEAAKEKSENTVEGDIKELSKREKVLCWTKKWEALLQVVVPSVLSLLVLVAIIAQAVIYWLQWKSMQDSIAETKHNRQLEYRAYVVVRTVRLTPNVKFPQLGDITVTEFNSGRTPAEGRIQAMLDYRTDSPPEDTVNTPGTSAWHFCPTYNGTDQENPN
jgi:hypothetical protein